MKSWYQAVCDVHGEAIDIFVSNPSCTAHYLADKDREVQAWLEQHYGCDLRMVGNDLQLDKLWDDGWKHVFGDTSIVKFRKETKNV